MSGPPNAPSDLLTEGQTNPTTVTNLAPKFSAIHTDPNEDSAIYYEIHVNTNDSFTGTEMWNSSKTSISSITNGSRSSNITYNGSALSPSYTTYYWRIRFWDTDDNMSDWSSTAQFTTYSNATPYAPSSLQTQGSTDSKKVSTTTPYFSAIFTDPNASDTGEYYEIEVNTEDSFTGTVMWSSGKSSISSITNGSRSSNITYNGSTLQLDGTTYYWRIRFWDNADAVSSWSPTAQFTMLGPPNSPLNLTVDEMKNPMRITSLTPNFSAMHTDPNEDSATHYEIHVNTNQNFNGTVMWNSGKKSMTSTPSGTKSPDIPYNGTPLTGTSDTTYYWRIRFWVSDNEVSEWSPVATFTDYIDDKQYIQMEGVLLKGVKINPPANLPPSAPTNLNPHSVSAFWITFSAQFNDPDIDDTGVYYQIEVNTNETFTGTVMWDSGKTSIAPIANGTQSSNIEYDGSSLSKNVTYYWRIKFWDNKGLYSPWSVSTCVVPSGQGQ
ncbi:hypothetical protein GX888_00825 [Candidatus Dojkabacteria bacterium]|uniref:Fibronectin type-III domain-containing protein n=1 Tax=Candidatus Dojkabacteria bacterium TaxID=2099670 RepID=A0A847VCU2_9BACT|nr:hypothetical protein [Candidatus Dojkabacteria bacterium]